MLKVNRREFLGIIGTTCLVALMGCNKTNTEKESHSMISMLALQRYELLTCENNKMLVKYVPDGRTFTVVKLENINDSLEEIEIYKRNIAEPNDVMDKFFSENSVIDNMRADQAFIDYYGLKDYYTIDEVTEILNQKSYQKTK